MWAFNKFQNFCFLVHKENTCKKSFMVSEIWLLSYAMNLINSHRNAMIKCKQTTQKVHAIIRSNGWSSQYCFQIVNESPQNIILKTNDNCKQIDLHNHRYLDDVVVRIFLRYVSMIILFRIFCFFSFLLILSYRFFFSFETHSFLKIDLILRNQFIIDA